MRLINARAVFLSSDFSNSYFSEGLTEAVLAAGRLLFTGAFLAFGADLGAAFCVALGAAFVAAGAFSAVPAAGAGLALFCGFCASGLAGVLLFITVVFASTTGAAGSEIGRAHV